MNKLVDKLFKGIDYFTGILTGLMVFFVFLNVVLRTFFNAGLTWSEELARYLFVYVTYIGATHQQNEAAGADGNVYCFPDNYCDLNDYFSVGF